METSCLLLLVVVVYGLLNHPTGFKPGEWRVQDRFVLTTASHTTQMPAVAGGLAPMSPQGTTVLPMLWLTSVVFCLHKTFLGVNTSDCNTPPAQGMSASSVYAEKGPERPGMCVSSASQGCPCPLTGAILQSTNGSLGEIAKELPVTVNWRMMHQRDVSEQPEMRRSAVQRKCPCPAIRDEGQSAITGHKPHSPGGENIRELHVEVKERICTTHNAESQPEQLAECLRCGFLGSEKGSKCIQCNQEEITRSNNGCMSGACGKSPKLEFG